MFFLPFTGSFQVYDPQPTPVGRKPWWRRWLRRSGIAVAALFLADPENTYMNGHVLVVDGGWTAGYARDF